MLLTAKLEPKALACIQLNDSAQTELERKNLRGKCMPQHFRFRKFLIFSLLFTCAWLMTMTLPSEAQLSWQSPPEPINQILDAPLPPAVFVSPDQQWLVELERSPLAPIAELAEPEVAIAGFRLNPKTNAPADHYTYRRLSIRPLNSGTAQTIDLPSDAHLSFFRWSPDGQRLAFTLTQESGLELWMVELHTGTTRRLTGPILNATYGYPCNWLPGEEGLVCKVVPEGRVPPSPPQFPRVLWCEKT